jgi:hypothetical protein
LTVQNLGQVLAEKCIGRECPVMTNMRSPQALAALTLAALARPALAEPAASPRATPTPPPIVAPDPLAQERAHDLYSVRAQRQIRAYMRLRMLELRADDLDRVRAVIEGRLGVDALFSPPPEQASRRAPIEKSCRERNDTMAPAR